MTSHTDTVKSTLTIVNFQADNTDWIIMKDGSLSASCITRFEATLVYPAVTWLDVPQIQRQISIFHLSVHQPYSVSKIWILVAWIQVPISG